MRRTTKSRVSFLRSWPNIRSDRYSSVLYELWRSRGAEFITEPKPKYGETRCYIRDPDGYIIEVGQSNPGVAYGQASGRARASVVTAYSAANAKRSGVRRMLGCGRVAAASSRMRRMRAHRLL